MRPRAALAATAIALATAFGAASCSFEPFCVAGDADCLEAGCTDGLKNGDETDTDCGGSCAPCGAGLVCAVDLDCTTERCAQEACCVAPCSAWSHAWGSLVDDGASAMAIAPDGSIYVAGRFSGAVDFGLGPLVSRGVDVFLVRLNPDGTLRWGQSFGGVLDDAQVELAITSSGHVVMALVGASQQVDFGGGVLVNEGGQNPYLVELDADGRHVWSRAIHTPGEASVSSVTIAPNGDIVISGSTYGVDLGGGLLESRGALDAYVGRLSPTGEHLWSNIFGDAWHDLGGRSAVDAEGNIYVLAFYSRRWSFGGFPLLPWANGTGSIAVAKLGPDGAHVWSHGYATGNEAGGQIATDIAVDDGGTVWITGSASEPTDFGGGIISNGVGQAALLLALGTDGGFRHARMFGEHTAFGLDLTPDGSGGVLLTGWYRGNVDFGEGVRLERGLDNLFVSRFDRDGRAAWARSGGGQFDSGVARVDRSPSADMVFVAGGFRGTLDPSFGGTTSAGEADTFVLALEP